MDPEGDLIVAETSKDKSRETIPGPPAGDILMRLKESPEDSSLALEARTAHKVEEATKILLDAFRKQSCERPSLSDGLISPMKCGAVAMALQALDPDSRTGENLLVRPVEAFLTERIPPAFPDEAAGQDKRFTPEYKAWCSERDLSPDEGLVREVMNGMSLYQLALIGDSKLKPLFRRGLESNSLSMVASSILGLGLIHDMEALPQVVAVIEGQKHMGEGAYYYLLLILRNYNDPEVDRIIAKAPNEELRNGVLAQPLMPRMLQLRPKL